MNIEDGGRAMGAGRAGRGRRRVDVGGRPSSVMGVRDVQYGGWRSDRVAVAMAVAPANTPVMTGQTEICITLGEARLAFPPSRPPPPSSSSPFFALLRATLRESIPRSPSNRRTFSA
jgi:hypothetical protein